MAVTRRGGPKSGQGLAKKWLKKVLAFLQPSNLTDFVLNPSRVSWGLALALLLAEVMVNMVVIWKVKYTEIDWVAYMQEVEGAVVNRTWDYSLLKVTTFTLFLCKQGKTPGFFFVHFSFSGLLPRYPET